VRALNNSVDTECNLERIATTRPEQWLYLVGEGGIVYSETRNRFAGLDALGVSAYRAFDADASVDDLRQVSSSASSVGLEAIHDLCQGIFPPEEAAADWHALDATICEPRTANIEIHGIPISLQYPSGPLQELCRDFFRNSAPSNRPACCQLSAQQTETGWAIYVNGHRFFSLQREHQLGLGLMHAARSMLYAEGRYDVAFHAAAVAHGGSGIMLCAPREAGKSTLAAYLVSQGLDLLTDEPALLDLDTGTLASLGVPLSLKQGSWSVLRRQWPQLDSAPIHLRSDGAKIRLVHPSAEQYSTQPRRLARIVFSQYSPSPAAEVEPVSPLHTLGYLNQGGMLLHQHLGRAKLEAFLEFICRTPAYKLRYSSLKDAHQILLELN